MMYGRDRVSMCDAQIDAAADKFFYNVKIWGLDGHRL
jgi:hypothetical protein